MNIRGAKGRAASETNKTDFDSRGFDGKFNLRIIGNFFSGWKSRWKSIDRVSINLFFSLN